MQVIASQPSARPLRGYAFTTRTATPLIAHQSISKRRRGALLANAVKQRCGCSTFRSSDLTSGPPNSFLAQASPSVACSENSVEVPDLDTKPRRSAPRAPAKRITPESARELLDEIFDYEKLGTRGEGWFLGQLVLILLVLFPPTGVRQIVDTLGGILLVSGLSLITLGTASLGQNLTPFPKPRDDHSLVTDGIFELVRHPMYGGIVLSTLGLTLATGDEARLALSAALFLLLNLKAGVEEEELEERYGEEYKQYKSKSKKLIPWLW